MLNRLSSNLVAVVVGLALMGVGTARAAVISWGTPQSFNALANPSQVSTKGALVDSYTLNSADVTLNGVTFNRRVSADTVQTATFNNSSITVTHDYYDYYLYPGAVPAGFDLIKWNAVTWPNGHAGTDASDRLITIGGLTIGKDYQVQVFGGAWDNQGTGLGLPPVTLDDDNDHSSGASTPLIVGIYIAGDTRPSQVILGTFTADSVTQAIYYHQTNTSYQATPAALQIREIPEPAAAASLLLAGGLLFARRRR